MVSAPAASMLVIGARVPHAAVFENVGVGKPARSWGSHTLSTRCHPEEAQAFATRRPANEGSLHSSGMAKNVIGCPTSRGFRDVGGLFDS